MTRPLKILAADRPDNAAFYYRVRAPFGVLDRTTQRASWHVKRASVADVNEYDILWLQQHADLHHQKVMTAFILSKKPVFYDVDDWLFEIPPSWDDAASFARERLGLHAEMLQIASVITTTTPYLASKIAGKLGDLGVPDKPIVILPNCIMQGDWDTILPAVPVGLNGPVLGYFGTINHWDDLIEIAPAIDAALEEVGGYLALIGPIELTYCFPERLKARVRHVPQMAMSKFSDGRAFIKAFDVGLAWATDKTEASRCRSPLKALQYGAAGVPWVASETVYGELFDSIPESIRDKASMWIAGTQEELEAALVFALRNAKSKAVMAGVREWQEIVWREHSYEQKAQAWMDVVRDVMGVDD